ncbi:hypothetical protein PLESTB_000894100 [Pleodorina starrii]|uniref:Uncharacterized protein n=1 Tax=Pleodorina starrii TaxID=330485 RepID=A0A9W6F2W9_9CHLO|nr:hypothetical protein PLESTM_000886800 [Pleodorina starrii]GLC54673.1 hypothetical protein PLESTB_000894100 [Pleodorina starrii]GLC67011.1 hypothetical protein PLESTF_000501900 [Pleodorina starrii]
MQFLARLALRPALLAGQSGVEATALATAACLRVQPGNAFARRWASSSPPSEDALRKAERMVEMMGQSSQLQQIMMNVLPGPMRNPEVFKQLFGDPAMRRRIAEIIAARGLSIPDHLLERMNPTTMDETFARASRLGLDPGTMFTKLMSHPGLLAKLQQPRVMAAFLDISEDPSRQAKYEGDKELLEVVHKVREIMGTARSASAAGTAREPAAASIELPPPEAAPQAGSVAAEAAPGRTPPPPGQPPQSDPATTRDADAADASWSPPGGASPSSGAGINPLVALMSTDPKAAKWLDNPQVMAALEEVHKSPWKTVKYVFNRDVMEAFKDLKELMRGKKL